MSRLLKIALYVLASVILLIVIAAVALPLFINPNDFKPEIQTAVKENTGRDLLINVSAIAVNPVDYKIRQNVEPDGDEVGMPLVKLWPQVKPLHSLNSVIVFIMLAILPAKAAMLSIN